jgi:hypothetical protein
MPKETIRLESSALVLACALPEVRLRWHILQMARRAVRVVEVTAPDGTTSFWGVYSIPRNEAVAAVKEKLPPNYTAELSFRRLLPGWKFAGAHPGDVIKLSHDANSERLDPCQHDRLAFSGDSRGLMKWLRN